MANTAREIPSNGLTTVFKFENPDTKELGDAIQLCGHDGLDFKDGKQDETDTTTFCEAADGIKTSIAGAKENGTLSINLKRFDPAQPAIKAYLKAPINTRLQCVVEYPTGDICTYYCQKKANPDWNSKLSEILNGSLDVATIGDPIWSKRPDPQPQPQPKSKN